MAFVIRYLIAAKARLVGRRRILTAKCKAEATVVPVVRGGIWFLFGMEIASLPEPAKPGSRPLHKS